MHVKRFLRYLHRDQNSGVKRQTTGPSTIGVLGLDARISGHVRFQGALTIDGTVVGDVGAPEGTGAVLVLGQHAVVRGDIVADSVLISGQVTGNVKAPERLEIFGTGVLLGDVETGDIMIQGGAEFQGSCQMLKHAPSLRDESGAPPNEAQKSSLQNLSATAENGRKGRKQKGGKHDAEIAESKTIPQP